MYANTDQELGPCQVMDLLTRQLLTSQSFLSPPVPKEHFSVFVPSRVSTSHISLSDRKVSLDVWESLTLCLKENFLLPSVTCGAEIFVKVCSDSSVSISKGNFGRFVRHRLFYGRSKRFVSPLSSTFAIPFLPVVPFKYSM